MVKVLGIETSCDETSVAIVSEDKTIIAHEIFSQIDEHKLYGGVVPEVAARSHMKHLELLIKKVEKDSKIALKDIDAIAVTAGPGLIGGVIVGVMYAKAIAAALDKPIIAVNHLEGHALTVRLVEEVDFPFLLTLVSGGHCQILYVQNVGCYSILGSTKDDAVGECFDKVAKMLGLGYPGGALIEKHAKDGDRLRFKFPQPLINEASCDFSFSGLKTAVKRQIDLLRAESANLSSQDVNDVCASLQHTIAKVLVHKIARAISLYPEVKTLVLSGGVAANQYLCSAINELANRQHVRFVAPPIKLCGDNAAMIAWAGIERFEAGLTDDLNFAPRSRWSLEELSNAG